MKPKTKIFIGFLLAIIILAGFFKFQQKNKVIQNPIHNASFSQKEPYEQAYVNYEDIKTPNDPIAGILVNHHLLAAPFIAEAVSHAETNSKITVLLISPNHFFSGKSNFISSLGSWSTPFGNLEADTQLINKLTAAQLISTEEDPFNQEHGISNIVGFIKYSLPNAKIVPIIIKDTVSVEAAIKTAKQINDHLPNNVLIVGSFDFSHYLTSTASDFHDTASLAAVRNFDYEAIKRLDIDSRPGLSLFLKLLETRENKKFHLLKNTNSSKLSNNYEILETTSYITGYFSQGKECNQNCQNISSAIIFAEIEANGKVIDSLNRYSPTFSIKFLERLFTGQDRTIAFVNTKTPDSIFKRLGFTDFINTSKTVQLKDYRIGLANGAEEKNLKDNARVMLDQGDADIAIINSNNISLEEHRGKIIVNGLGKFLTNRSLSENSTSLGLGFSEDNTTVKIFLLPIRFENGVGKLLTKLAGDIVLNEIANKSAISNELKEQIKQGLIIINK